MLIAFLKKNIKVDDKKELHEISELAPLIVQVTLSHVLFRKKYAERTIDPRATFFH